MWNGTLFQDHVSLKRSQLWGRQVRWQDTFFTGFLCQCIKMKILVCSRLATLQKRWNTLSPNLLLELSKVASHAFALLSYWHTAWLCKGRMPCLRCFPLQHQLFLHLHLAALVFCITWASNLSLGGNNWKELSNMSMALGHAHWCTLGGAVFVMRIWGIWISWDFDACSSPKRRQTMLWCHNTRVNSQKRWQQTRRELISAMSAI